MNFVAERDQALATLDMEYARKMIPAASSDEVRLIALHKARYEAVSIDPILRHSSGVWLKKRGYRRLGGMDFLPSEELPE